ncbi:MAG: accessory gene regulator B family protein [Eubacteriales bacterium]|nr:accessory gene regulator B family protein [Eubacteriales bacterium]
MGRLEEKWLYGFAEKISANKDEYEVVQYGLHQSVLIMVNFLSILICGAFWGELLFSLLLFMVIFFLRPYAGGYHADTELRCYMISVGAMNAAMFLRKSVTISITIEMVMYIGAVLYIWINAPLENPQNELEEIEIEEYSRKANQILLVCSLLTGLSLYFKNRLFLDANYYGIIIVATAVLTGKWKYKKKSLPTI